MRQRRKTVRSSAQKSSPRSSVLTRLADLEERVRVLEARSDRAHIGALEPEQSRGPGAPTKINDPDLFASRDKLIGVLEAVWDRVGNPLARANSKDSVRNALADYLPEEQVRFMLERATAILEFLKSGRFQRKPVKATVRRALDADWLKPKTQKAAMALPTRRIASAIAGVPKLKWRTSYDRCMRSPCQTVVGKTASEVYRIAVGIGWPKDIWDQAKKGCAPSQYSIGLSYAHGLEVKKHLQVAAHWFERAAMQGNSDAQLALAEAYVNGSGVEKSARLAYMWAAQVPMTPERQEWKKRIAKLVPRKDLARVSRLALELRPFISQFQDGRGIRLADAPRTEAIKISENIRTLLRKADGQSELTNARVGSK